MALKIEKVDSDSYETKGRLAPVLPLEESPEDSYLLLMLENWRLIAAVTLIAIIATYIFTKTAMTKWYRATAVIEPVPEGAVENRLEGGLGGFSGGGMSSFLMMSGMDTQAQEYLTILRSFTFNTGVALRHNLTNELMQDSDEKPKDERELKMKLFDILKGRFSVDYSIQAHNLSVHFIDQNPVRAEQIVQFYLDDLRELQRREAIRDSSDAISSLQKEASTTGDSLLREGLYALVARQLQREKLAEVEADFAFRVLEPPIAPDKPYSPLARLNCFIVLLLTPLIMSAVILLHRKWYGDRKLELPHRRRSAGEHDASF